MFSSCSLHNGGSHLGDAGLEGSSDSTFFAGFSLAGFLLVRFDDGFNLGTDCVVGSTDGGSSLMTDCVTTRGGSDLDNGLAGGCHGVIGSAGGCHGDRPWWLPCHGDIGSTDGCHGIVGNSYLHSAGGGGCHGDIGG